MADPVTGGVPVFSADGTALSGRCAVERMPLPSVVYSDSAYDASSIFGRLAIDVRKKMRDFMSRDCFCVMSSEGHSISQSFPAVDRPGQPPPVLLYSSEAASQQLDAGLKYEASHATAAGRLQRCYYFCPPPKLPAIFRVDTKTFTDGDPSTWPWLEGEALPVLDVYVPIAFAEELGLTMVPRNFILLINGQSYVAASIIATYAWKTVTALGVGVDLDSLRPSDISAAAISPVITLGVSMPWLHTRTARPLGGGGPVHLFSVPPKLTATDSGERLSLSQPSGRARATAAEDWRDALKSVAALSANASSTVGSGAGSEPELFHTQAVIVSLWTWRRHFYATPLLLSVADMERQAAIGGSQFSQTACAGVFVKRLDGRTGRAPASDDGRADGRLVRRTALAETVRDFALDHYAIVPAAVVKSSRVTLTTAPAQMAPSPSCLYDLPCRVDGFTPKTLHLVSVWDVAECEYSTAERSISGLLSAYRHGFAATRASLIASESGATRHITEEDVFAFDPALRETCDRLLHELNSVHYCVPVHIEDPVDTPGSIQLPKKLSQVAVGDPDCTGTVGFALVPLPLHRKAWAAIGKPAQLLQSYDIYVFCAVPCIRMRVNVRVSVVAEGFWRGSASFFLDSVPARQETREQLLTAQTIRLASPLLLPWSPLTGNDWPESAAAWHDEVRTASTGGLGPPHRSPVELVNTCSTPGSPFRVLKEAALPRVPLLRDPRTHAECLRALQLLVPPRSMDFGNHVLAEWDPKTLLCALSLLPALLLSPGLRLGVPGMEGCRALIWPASQAFACGKVTPLDTGVARACGSAPCYQRTDAATPRPRQASTTAFAPRCVPLAEACGDFAASPAAGVVRLTPRSQVGRDGDEESAGTHLDSLTVAAASGAQARFLTSLLRLMIATGEMASHLDDIVGCTDGGFYFLHALFCAHEQTPPGILFKAFSTVDEPDVPAELGEARMRALFGTFRSWKANGYSHTLDRFGSMLTGVAGCGRALVGAVTHNCGLMQGLVPWSDHPGPGHIPLAQQCSCAYSESFLYPGYEDDDDEEGEKTNVACWRTSYGACGGSSVAQFLRIWTRICCQLTTCGRELLAGYDPAQGIPVPAANEVPLWRIPEVVKEAGGDPATAAAPWAQAGASSTSGAAGAGSAAADDAGGVSSDARDIDAILADIEGPASGGGSGGGKGKKKKGGKAIASVTAPDSAGTASSSSASQTQTHRTAGRSAVVSEPKSAPATAPAPILAPAPVPAVAPAPAPAAAQPAVAADGDDDALEPLGPTDNSDEGREARALHKRLLELRTSTVASSAALEELRTQLAAGDAERAAEVAGLESEGAGELATVEGDLAAARRLRDELTSQLESALAFSRGEPPPPPLTGDELTLAAAAEDSTVASLVVQRDGALATLRSSGEALARASEAQEAEAAALAASDAADQSRLHEELAALHKESADLAGSVAAQVEALTARANAYAAELQSHLETSLAAHDVQVGERASALQFAREEARGEREAVVASAAAAAQDAVESELARLRREVEDQVEEIWHLEQGQQRAEERHQQRQRQKLELQQLQQGVWQQQQQQQAHDQQQHYSPHQVEPHQQQQWEEGQPPHGQQRELYQLQQHLWQHQPAQFPSQPPLPPGPPPGPLPPALYPSDSFVDPSAWFANAPSGLGLGPMFTPGPGSTPWAGGHAGAAEPLGLPPHGPGGAQGHTYELGSDFGTHEDPWAMPPVGPSGSGSSRSPGPSGSSRSPVNRDFDREFS